MYVFSVTSKDATRSFDVVLGSLSITLNTPSILRDRVQISRLILSEMISGGMEAMN